MPQSDVQPELKHFDPLRSASRRRRTLLWVLGPAVLVAGFFLLPEPSTHLKRLSISDDELRKVIADMTFKTLPRFSPGESSRAALGKKFFHEVRFSANGSVACATCHRPEHSFADNLPVSRGLADGDKNTPPLINLFAAHWFFWDGRADSLEAQALGPTENAREHGVSRALVARVILQNYREEYEAAFGKVPSSLSTHLPDHALPRTAAPQMAPSIAAYALGTIGRLNVLTSVLLAAERNHRAPVAEVAALAAQQDEHPPSWQDAYDAMPLEARTQLDQMFANFGRAIAMFERSLVAKDSPFDTFAAKVVGGETSVASLSPAFNQRALDGLKLFVGPGQCTLCHAGPLLSDQQFHNNGLEARADKIDPGRAQGVLVALADPFNCRGALLPLSTDLSESCKELPYLATDNFELVGAFKTPTLRNVAVTAPYFHDGRAATLDDVLQHYNDLDEEPAIGHREESLKPLRFSKEELGALKAFLNSLTSVVVEHDYK